jgi:hypothetical protein
LPVPQGVQVIDVSWSHWFQFLQVLKAVEGELVINRLFMQVRSKTRSGTLKQIKKFFQGNGKKISHEEFKKLTANCQICHQKRRDFTVFQCHFSRRRQFLDNKGRYDFEQSNFLAIRWQYFFTRLIIGVMDVRVSHLSAAG